MSKKVKRQRNREHLQLPGGNSATVPYIHPANWDTKKGSVKGKWYVRFTYYDCIKPVERIPGEIGKGHECLQNPPG